jgi:rRNA-processing protein FCF1
MTKTTISERIEKDIRKAIKQKTGQGKKSNKAGLLEIASASTTKPTKKAVVLDTNFLLIPGEYKIDIFRQSKDILNTNDIDFIVFDKTIYELQSLAQKKSKYSSSAKVGLSLINDKNISIMPSKDDKYVDNMFLDIESYFPKAEREIIVATQDKELKQRLMNQESRSKKIRIIFMQSKKKLGIR